MNIEQMNNKEHAIPIDINSKEIISLNESLSQQLVDMKVEIFLNQSEQYLLSTEKKQAVNFS